VQIAILQHQDDAPAGLLLDVLARRGFAWNIVHVDRGEPFPDPHAVSVAVSLGSEASAGDHERPWVAEELAWLRAADQAGTPLLGVCFGAQALAVALGGAVRRAWRPERDWVTISTAAPELIAPGPWLAWHEDSLLPPAGARVLAENESGVQAFGLRSHLGVQFHPEVTSAIVDDWLRTSDDRPRDQRALLDGAAAHFERARAGAYRLFEGFLAAGTSE
jgi:GMP synthase-like glutamine amidotransferase